VVATNRVDQIVHGWHLPADPAAGAKLVDFTLDDGLDAWAVAFSPAKMRTDFVVLGFSDARQWQVDLKGADQVALTPSITLNAQGEVASASFSPDGQYLVTGARDKAARVWNVKTGLGMVKLQGVHTGPLNAAVWAPQGQAGEQYILTASDDKTAVLWKLTADGPGNFQAEAVRTFKGHTGSVLDAAFSPKGERFVTVSSDKTARLWETATGNLVAQTSPQGDELLCVAVTDDGKRILTGSADNQATIWVVESRNGKMNFKPILSLQGHSARVTDVAFSPVIDLNNDGNINEEEEDDVRAVTASADNSVIVWHTRNPKFSEDDSEVPKANQVLTLKRHNRPVNAVRFSPDGRYILTGSEDHRAILWPTKEWMTEKVSAIKKDEERKDPKTEKLVGSTSGNEK
jgi:WD40 repeat protein